MSIYSGVPLGLGSIDRVVKARTRLITAENVYGEKGKGGMAQHSDTPQPEVLRIGQRWDKRNSEPARELGQKWKVRPHISVSPGESAVLADVDGPGYIQHIWITTAPERYRDLILRIYWDGEESPSVESPLGDFFCQGFNTYAPVLAEPINVNPTNAMNCYFPMPFRGHAKITLENRAPEEVQHLFYAITMAETGVPEESAYFHAQFRRTNPLPYGEDYVILDDVAGPGHYVGTYMAWQQNNSGWWGEGEIKFFLDGDDEFPTLCGTGTEDYFGGAWGFGATFTAPYLGYPLGGKETVGTRHGLYRFHILDPIRFEENLRVTIQAIGWRSERRFLPLQDDIASVAYWYQTEPHKTFSELPSRDYLEVI